ncbi:helix-turn-helix domain-containing protein [Paenibacillus sp. GYB003]|uniref:helix-turn-helix domain-containing protein n=1 Tax=Paenibacillus sp. GYB003 TaxID=2994392 RepID=UPI002F967890
MERVHSRLFRLTAAEAVESDAGRLPMKETSAAYSLLVVAAGSGEAFIEGKACRLNPGDVIFMNPGAGLEIGRTFGNQIKWHAATFEIWRVAETDPNGRQVLEKEMSGFLETGKLETPFSAALSSLVAQLVEVRRNADEGARFLADSLFMNAMHYLVRPATDGDERDSERRIREAVAYINENYRATITRDFLSRRCGLSPEYFSSAFKKATGCTFADYLARVRIAKAKERLLLAKGTLNQVAQSVGYSDGLYLSRKFKRVVGLSPTAYIKKPKTIVCLQYLGHILALGLAPAGTTAKQLTPFARHPHVTGIRDVGVPASPAKIAELAPDIILTIREKHEHLSQIATTVALPWGQLDPLKELEYFGELLDRRNEAEAWIAEFREKEECARREVAGIVGAGESVAVYEIWGDRIWAVNIGYGRGTRNVYKTFGYAPPRELADFVLGKGPGKEIPFERFPQYAADHMFITVWNKHGGERRAKALMESEQWRMLDAVRNGRVYKIDLDTFVWNDPISIERQLAVQIRLLKRQADGISVPGFGNRT